MRHATGKLTPETSRTEGEWALGYLEKRGIKEEMGRSEVKKFLELGYPRIACDAISAFGLNDKVGSFKPDVIKAVKALLDKRALYRAADAVSLFKLTEEEVASFRSEAMTQLPEFVEKARTELKEGWADAVNYVAGAFRIPGDKVIAITNHALLRTDISTL